MQRQFLCEDNHPSDQLPSQWRTSQINATNALHYNGISEVHNTRRHLKASPLTSAVSVTDKYLWKKVQKAIIFSGGFLCEDNLPSDQFHPSLVWSNSQISIFNIRIEILSSLILMKIVCFFLFENISWYWCKIMFYPILLQLMLASCLASAS